MTRGTYLCAKHVGGVWFVGRVTGGWKRIVFTENHELYRTPKKHIVH